MADIPAVTGYLHPDYARSLSEFGSAFELPRSGGWVLRRKIPGFPFQDAMGCYPLFNCRDWSLLPADLEDLNGEVVTIALVADPFGDYDVEQLQGCFDFAIPYKQHFVIDLDLTAERFVSKHHLREVLKAERRIQVEPCEDPVQFLDEWMRLYSSLIARHRVSGIRAFSRAAFERQLRVPGMILLRAVSGGATVGADWYCVQGDVAHAHLGAYSSLGYESGACYALQWAAVEYFAARVRWLNLGAGAGRRASKSDGLSRFKRGWSTGTRTAYFCGRIFDRKKYEQIVNANGGGETGYFPAYREGEFS